MNAIQIALTHKNQLASWQSEVEIASFNTISRSPYEKDYDAIVDVWVGDNRARFALEYERTPKAQTEYDRIVSLLERERNLDRVLYLAGTRHIRSLLKQRLWRIRQRVLIGLASDLPKTEPADLEVVDAQTMQVHRLVDIP